VRETQRDYQAQIVLSNDWFAGSVADCGAGGRQGFLSTRAFEGCGAIAEQASNYYLSSINYPI